MSHSRRRASLSLLVAIVVVTISCPRPERAVAAMEQRKTPRHEDTNVIMISVDTLRRDHLGCYGYARDTSRNIDDFAKQSVVFDNFISQAVLTPVSQMSILTSQYPTVNGLVSFQPAIEKISSKTFQEILKSYGYQNAAFVGSPEFIDQRYTNTQSGAENKDKLFSRSFDYYVPSQGSFRDVPEEALAWVRDHKNTKFFLWLPIGTVHWPYSSSVPAPYRTKFDPEGYTPFFAEIVKNDRRVVPKDAVNADVLSYIYKDQFYGDSKRPYILTQRDREYIVGRYDAGIFYVDVFIGKLLSLLKELGLSKKTLVVFYSTHGEDLGEHGYYGHYDLYDTEARNALLIHFPESALSGRRIDRQVQGIDVVPTLLEYLDIPVHHEAEGVSLLPELVGSRSEDKGATAFVARIPLFEYVLYKGRRLFNVATRQSQALDSYRKLLDDNLREFDAQAPPYDMAVRTNDWKLIVRNHAPLLRTISWWRFVSGRELSIDEVELYDLKRDPMEQINVASRRPDIVATLMSKLREWDASVKARAAGDQEKTERFLIPYP